MNTQAITNSWLVPYHFPLFYLHPISTAAIIIIFIQNFTTKYTKGLAVGSFFVTVFFINCVSVRRLNAARAETDEFGKLATFISENIRPDQNILMQPWTHPFDSEAKDFHVYLYPYWMNSLTLRGLFLDPMKSSFESSFERELVSGLIYSGKLQLIAPCPKTAPELPGDTLRGVLTQEMTRRYNFCARALPQIPLLNICDLVKHNAPDYVLWQGSGADSMPTESKELLESVWHSKDGELGLFRYRKDQAVKMFCPLGVS